MRILAPLLILGTLLTTAPAAQAAEPPTGFWTTPTIQGFGRIHYLPNAAYRPRADQTYRIVFSVTQDAMSPATVNASLDHVARTVNLYAAAGLPLSHLKFVAIVSGGATPLVMNNVQFRAAYGVDNPNLPLVAELRQAGVDVAVCGQAVAEHGIQYDWIHPGITLALSGLTTVTTLEHQGYDLLQL